MWSRGSVIIPMISLVWINMSVSAFICSDAGEVNGDVCSGDEYRRIY